MVYEDLHQVGHWTAYDPFGSMKWAVVLIADNMRVLAHEDNGSRKNKVVVGLASTGEDTPPAQMDMRGSLPQQMGSIDVVSREQVH